MTASVLSELSIADRHRRLTDDFADRAARVTDWEVPTPVAGWLARDVVDHLVSWSGGLFAGAAGLDFASVPAAAGDPVGAWRAHGAVIQRALDDGEVAAREVSAGPMGPMRLDAMLDAIYLNDIFMHQWDLAVATGGDTRLDPAYCEHLLGGVRAMEQPMRESGQFGPAVPVADDADPQTCLLGFIGRDPGWRPPPTR